MKICMKKKIWFFVVPFIVFVSAGLAYLSLQKGRTSESNLAEYVSTKSNSEVENPNRSVESQDGVIGKHELVGFSDVSFGSFEERASKALLEQDPRIRRELLAQLIADWAEKYPRKAYDWAMSVENLELSERSRLVGSVIALSLSEGDWENAQELTDAIPRGFLRDEVILYQAESFAQEDLEYAFVLVASISNESHARLAIEGVARSLVKSEQAENLSRIIESLPHGALRKGLGEGIANRLSKENPDSGLDFMVANPEVISISSLITLADQFKDKDPQDALLRGQYFEDPQQRAIFTGGVAQDWAQRDREESLDWLINSMVGGFAERENQVMFEAMADASLEQDQTFLFEKLATIKDEAFRNQATLRALEPLASLDPSRALKMVLDIPGNKKKVISESMSNWLTRDPLAASAWIDDNLEYGADRDVAVNVLVNSIIKVEKDYESAVGWASTVSSEVLKEQLLQKAEKLKN